MKEFMKTAAKTAIAITGIYAVTAITTYVGNYVGDVVSDLVTDGIEEMPDELSKVKDFTKKMIHKEKLFLKKFKDKLNHDTILPEEEITLTDEEYKKEMADIEKEVSQL